MTERESEKVKVRERLIKVQQSMIKLERRVFLVIIRNV